MDLKLAHASAIISGGGRGIGLAVARRLIAEGASCVLMGRGKVAQEEAVVLRHAGAKVWGVECSTLHTSEVANAVMAAVEFLGKVEIVVNCAARVSVGTGDNDKYLTVDESKMLRDFDEKVIGYLRVIRAALPYMNSDWGRIINVSGSNAHLPGKVSAGARNIALVHLTKTLSVELGQKGITVNVIHPHITLTDKVRAELVILAERDGMESLEYMGRLGRENDIGRLVEVQEVADVVGFLASPLASAVTGESIGVGGGYCADVKL